MEKNTKQTNQNNGHHTGNKVNETLKLPLEPEFERDLRAALAVEDSMSPLVILFLDADHFMQINKSFGPELGDQVLIDLGSYLQQNLPDCAKLYRVGGDEFGIIFTDKMEKEDVFLWAERIRAGLNLEMPDKTALSISVSIAAAYDDGSSYHELVRKARGAMFRGKINGGGKVCLAREEKMVTKTSHYTTDQLQRLTKLSKREGIGEAILLREALDLLLQKYDV